MAIKETTKKIHFRPWAQTKGRPDVREKPAPTVTISRKFNTLTFSKALVVETGMEGKFVRVYYEPTKKIIGWQLREQVMQEEMKVWKLCKPSVSGTWMLGVKKLLDEFNNSLTQESYPGLEVQKYREMGALDQYSGQTFFYVELKDKGTEHED